MDHVPNLISTGIVTTVYCLLAAWVAFRAEEQGYRRVVWFVAGIVVTPLVTLLLLALLDRPNTPRRFG